MLNYETKYPSKIQLSDGQTLTLTLQDNKERQLITEVNLKEVQLRNIFSQNGFENIRIMEEIKSNQIGCGMRKHIDKDWDIHVRFLNLHERLVSIDAEVETNMEYVEHVTTENWVSVLSEIWDIIRSITNGIWLFHKKSGQYVRQILENITIKMTKFKNQIEWKPIAAVAGIVLLAGLILHDSTK